MPNVKRLLRREHSRSRFRLSNHAPVGAVGLLSKTIETWWTTAKQGMKKDAAVRRAETLQLGHRHALLVGADHGEAALQSPTTTNRRPSKGRSGSPRSRARISNIQSPTIEASSTTSNRS